MAFFKLKARGKTYEIEHMTLLDGFILERDFGLNVEHLAPDFGTTLALLALAIHKNDGIPLAEARQLAEGMGVNEVEAVEEPAEEADPTKAGGNGGTGGRAKTGGSGKRQKKPGTQS